MSDGPVVTPLQVQANRFQLVSRLADDLAHEIKNPLHGMVINLELMKRRAQAGKCEDVVQRAEFVCGEIMRVNGLIDQLLTLVRPPRSADGQPVEDVDELVGDLLPVLEAQARLSGVELVYQGVGAREGATIRRDALRLVLLNLFAAVFEQVRVSRGSVRVSLDRGEAAMELVVAGSLAGPTAPGRLSSLEVPPAPARDSTLAAAGREPDDDVALGLAVARHLLAEAGGTLMEFAGEAGERFIRATFPAAGPLDPGLRAPVL